MLRGRIPVQSKGTTGRTANGVEVAISDSQEARFEGMQVAQKFTCTLEWEWG